ncbi:MAG: alanine--tRNA ligase, partial [Clostridiales bacterium]|nr:alanine--tRNA ligase [Clostridiales bacterium]
PLCGIGHCDCDRWMEIWNLVFMQYDRDEAGVLTPLPKPSIDTGMGLERVSSILQDKDSNYDTDLLNGIIKGVEFLCGRPYHPGPPGFPFRVIADHARACSFLIADGVTPANEGRGYVLRRILRRAARFGRQLGFEQPFLYRVFPYVRDGLSGAYPELVTKADIIEQAIRLEEERFHVTLTAGIAYAQGMIEKTRKQGREYLAGEDLFLLYDTYGFPLDLAKDIAEEHGLTVDEAGFNDAMEEQRRRARAARAEAAGEETALQLGQLLAHIPAGEFLGYQTPEVAGQVTAIVADGESRDSAIAGQSCYITLTASPFYAESGGQVGDRGQLFAPSGYAEVCDTRKLPNGLIIHQTVIKQGIINLGDTVSATVDMGLRRAVCRNHSATHLLHQALRRRLGEHARQAGSLVNAERLRFDFSSIAPLSAEELADIEAEVNRIILENLPISTDIMSIEEAKDAGAIAFFGDKYGDTVRVVRMGDYSMELCGGTHCANTGEISSLKIISEGGIGAGLRRIEALTGAGALHYYRQQEQQLAQLATLLKCAPNDAGRRAEILLSEHRSLQKELEKARMAQAQGNIDGLIQGVVSYGGIKTLAAEVRAANINDLRNTLDLLRDKLPQAAITLAARIEDKVQFVISVAADAQAAGLHAGQLIKQVAAVCGGGGGGKPDMAQAGGKDNSPEKVSRALQLARELIEAQLKAKE